MTDAAHRRHGRPRAHAVARLAYRALRRLDRDALSADLDARELVQARRRNLLQRLALAVELQPRRLLARLVRAAGELRPVLRQFGDRVDLLRHRQRAHLLARRLRVRAAEVLGARFLVRADARHPDAALPRHPDPAICAVPAPRLGEHLPAAGRAEIPRRRRVLHLPAHAVLPHASRASSTRPR